MQSPRDCEPAPISQRRDNETRSHSHVLVGIPDGRVHLFDNDLLTLVAALILIVIAQALLPLEIFGLVKLEVIELFNDVLIVDVKSD